MNVELSSFFNMKRALFVVDTLEYVMDVVVHCSHSVEQLFCSGRGEFVVVVKVYGAWVKPIETSVGGEIVGCGGGGVIGKFCKR